MEGVTTPEPRRTDRIDVNERADARADLVGTGSSSVRIMSAFSSEGGSQRRLERLAVGRVEELKDTRARRTAIEYLNAAAGHY